MRRRQLLVSQAAAAVLAPALGWTQGGAAQRRIGILANGSPEPQMPAPIEALRDALRELGYVDGRSAMLDYRWAEGRIERLPELAAELVRLGVEVIVAAGDAPTRAAVGATRSIPIVMATSGDAVGAGFVASLARPGGNVTGMTAINPELAAKRLQLLRELLPKASRIALLWDPTDRAHSLELKASAAAARRLDISAIEIAMRSEHEVGAAFDQVVQMRADALVVFNNTMTVAARPQIIERAARQRMAAMYEAREWALAGGLLAYGVAHADLFRQCAQHVDKILRGARPAELPVEQPTRLRLTLNRATAATLGVTFVQALLLRADEVVE